MQDARWAGNSSGRSPCSEHGKCRFDSGPAHPKLGNRLSYDEPLASALSTLDSNARASDGQDQLRGREHSLMSANPQRRIPTTAELDEMIQTLEKLRSYIASIHGEAEHPQKQQSY